MLAKEYKDKDAANATLEVHMSSCSTYRAYLCNMLLSHTRVRRQISNNNIWRLARNNIWRLARQIISGAWPDSVPVFDKERKSALTPPTF
jgi:hypothetical protein